MLVSPVEGAECALRSECSSPSRQSEVTVSAIPHAWVRQGTKQLCKMQICFGLLGGNVRMAQISRPLSESS